MKVDGIKAGSIIVKDDGKYIVTEIIDNQITKMELLDVYISKNKITEDDIILKKFYIYECDSPMCRGEQYAVTEQPLSCPYCDSVATEEKPKFVITDMKFVEVI